VHTKSLPPPGSISIPPWQASVHVEAVESTCVLLDHGNECVIDTTPNQQANVSTNTVCSGRGHVYVRYANHTAP
jgi:hypothetical protein